MSAFFFGGGILNTLSPCPHLVHNPRNLFHYICCLASPHNPVRTSFMVGPFRQLPHPREARQLHRLHRLQLQPEAAATTATGGDIILGLNTK